ncbi:MAG: DUF1330 domain-containing protein [SAR324 cluster bacterium]|nr:DUF1330 domain-containing protein [SAR324 cluster bacterium]
MPPIEKHGGRITHRIGAFEAWEGDWLPSRMVIIEFPHMSASAPPSTWTTTANAGVFCCFRRRWSWGDRQAG